MINASFHIADQSIVETALYRQSQMVWVWAVGYRKCCVWVILSGKLFECCSESVCV